MDHKHWQVELTNQLFNQFVYNIFYYFALINVFNPIYSLFNFIRFIQIILFIEFISCHSSLHQLIHII
jgi:hypothetical protein